MIIDCNDGRGALRVQLGFFNNLNRLHVAAERFILF